VKNLTLKSGSALVIVAHPDDETIWMGGTILAHPKIKWTIFALCRASDIDRAPKFRKVCRYYRARSIIADLEDEGIMNVIESVPKIIKIIKQKIGKKKFDYIFTHGPNGEYGHLRHSGASRAVDKIIKSRELRCGQFLNFAYKTNAQNKILNSRRAKFFIKLSHKELSEKRNIIKKLYGFSKTSFEYKSCSSLETFNEFSI